MKTLFLVLQVLPHVLEAIIAIEKIADVPREGSTKLDFLKAVVAVVFEECQDVAKEVGLEKFNNILTKIAGASVTFLKAVKIFK